MYVWWVCIASIALLQKKSEKFPPTDPSPDEWLMDNQTFFLFSALNMWHPNTQVVIAALIIGTDLY